MRDSYHFNYRIRNIKCQMSNRPFLVALGWPGEVVRGWNITDREQLTIR